VSHFLFVPGGPGFTANEEARVLGPRLQAVGWSTSFWNDPSRADSAPRPSLFEEYLASLEATIRGLGGPHLTVACHSAAVHGVLIAMQRADVEIGRLVMIAPSLSQHDAFCRVLTLAASDFDGTRPDQANRIRTLLAGTQVVMDGPMREGLIIAADDAQLFTHYWRDPLAFTAFADAVSRPAGEFRPDTFFAIMDGLAALTPSYLEPDPRLSVPATIVFGGGDPVIDREMTLASARRIFSHLDDRTFDGAGHWVHLERPDEFLKIVCS